MPTFVYYARSPAGEKVSGTLHALSRKDAMSAIAARSLLPVHVTPLPERGSRRQTLPSTSYALLSDLLRTGVPMLRSLEILRDQSRNPTHAKIFQELREQLADGAALSQAMSSSPATFDKIAIGMIEAGEAGGFVEESLRHVAALKERSAAVRSRILGAIFYPALLVIFGTAIVIGLLVFFIPGFAPVFERLAAQGELPWATRFLLGLSSLLRSSQVIYPLLFVGVLFLPLADPTYRRAVTQKMLNVLAMSPIVGPLIREISLARFTRVLGTLLANQVAMVAALMTAANSIGLQALAEDVQKATDQVTDGKRLSETLCNSQLIPRDVAAMFAVGEQANNLDSVMLEVAAILEQRIEKRTDIFVKILEPLLLLVLAAIVLFLVVGLMLPIFDASGAVQRI